MKICRCTYDDFVVCCEKELIVQRLYANAVIEQATHYAVLRKLTGKSIQNKLLQ